MCERLGARHSERVGDMITPPEQPHVMLDRRLLVPMREPLRAPFMPDANSVGESDCKLANLTYL